MQIIPVIDLKNGLVVHAKRGQRAHYQPIQSRLSTTSNAPDIVAGLLALYPFQTFYIADIDAIQGNGSHAEMIDALCREYPHITWWLDSGNTPNNGPGANIRAVIGTESLQTLAQYRSIKTPHVLSLDSLNGENLGCAELHADCALWPPQVIAMSLSSVGSGYGPDFTRLQQLHTQAPQASLYAAGGVRHAQDLHGLRHLGIAGALVATALHNGSLSAKDLNSWAQ